MDFLPCSRTALLTASITSEKSKISYEKWFKKYRAWSGETPESLVLKGKDIEWLDDHLKSWYEKLRRQGLSLNSRKIGYNTVRSFLSWNHTTMPRSPREISASVTYESDRIYTKEEIQKLLALAENTRDEALLLAISHSPQRTEVWRALKRGMVSSQVAKGGIIVFSIPAQLLDSKLLNCNKASVAYKFGSGIEATEKIREMMEERKLAWRTGQARIMALSVIQRLQVPRPSAHCPRHTFDVTYGRDD